MIDTTLDTMYNSVVPYQGQADAVVKKAREELALLFRQREELDVRIARQQRRLAALAVLVDDSERTDQLLDLHLGGLTDAIRTALRTAGPRGLTTGEVTARLDQLFFPVNEYSNFRASLGTVLKRLSASGEVRKSLQGDRVDGEQVLYLWVGAIKNRLDKPARSRKPGGTGRRSRNPKAR